MNFLELFGFKKKDVVEGGNPANSVTQAPAPAAGMPFGTVPGDPSTSGLEMSMAQHQMQSSIDSTQANIAPPAQQAPTVEVPSTPVAPEQKVA